MMGLKLVALAGLGAFASIALAEPAAAQRLQFCAEEHGFCRVPYPTTVVYGAGGRRTSREVGGRGIPCHNGAFGDPAPGTPKSCFFVVRGYRGDYDRPRRRDYD
jgi:hypothetical protein